MLFRSLISLLCFLVFTSLAMAGENINKSAQAAILTQFPTSEVYIWTQGTLDDENSNYIVALIRNNDLNDLPLRLIVLRKENDEYKIVIKSQSWMSHQRISWNIGIKNKSVFLSQNGSGGCCSHSESTYQFEKSGDKFLLIGVEELGVEVINDETGKLYYYEYGTSTNHLTDKVIHWRNSGDEITMWDKNVSWHTPWRLAKIKKHTEKTLDFTSDRQWGISNFSYYDYVDWISETKSALCGYIGQDFRYHSCSQDGANQ